jgi:hypothetical protein
VVLRARRSLGYDASAVDDLLARVASELDAARAAGPLVENAGGRAVTSTASACSWASSFLTLGLGATSATWPSSAGTRPLTSPTAGPVWRGEGADGRHKRGGLFRRRMLKRVARLRPPNRHAPVGGAGRMTP